MGLADELRDPWGLVAGGVSGGMAWALTATALGGPPAIALGAVVGATVLGVKALTGVLVNRPREDERAPVPRPPRSSAAGGWVERAERAAQAMEELARTAPAGPTGEALRAAAAESADTLDALLRVGVQVTAVERALGSVGGEGLEHEAVRLEAAADQARDPELQAEVRRSAAAVRDRLAVRERLRGARATLLARMQAGALGLEGLVARLAEVLALTHTTGGVDTTADEVAELAGELEGLRAGLAETEAISRRALAGAPPPHPAG